MTSDADIRRNVEKELTWEPALDDKGIMIKVQGGVVTLGGAVPHYSDRWAAEQVAKRVSGVCGIANDIEVIMPRAGERSDTEIASAAVNIMKWHCAMGNCDIKPVVIHGRVTLTGEVQYAFQSETAENAVRQLAGVKAVTNDVLVKPSVKAVHLKEKIEDAFERQANLDASGITVNVRDADVTLDGSVHSWWEKDAAERAARSAPGVAQVDNHIQVQF